MNGNLDLTYATYLTAQYEAVIAAIDAVLAVEVAALLRILKPALAFFFLIQFIRFGGGYIGWQRLLGELARALLIAAMLGAQGLYIPIARNTVVEHVPAAVAEIVTGQGSRLAPTRQFDVVSQAADNLTADIRRRNTSWSVSAFGNSIATVASNVSLQFWIAVQAGVWMVSIRLLAIALCLGPWLLIFELFERTRGFFTSWIGIMAGLLCFQLASAIYMQIALRSQMALLRAVQAAGDAGIDEMLARLLHIANAIFTDALTMLFLPAICAIAGGAAAHVGATKAFNSLPGAAGRAYDKIRKR